MRAEIAELRTKARAGSSAAGDESAAHGLHSGTHAAGCLSPSPADALHVDGHPAMLASNMACKLCHPSQT